MSDRRFDAGAALHLLSELPPTLRSEKIDAAWEAAWLACFTASPRWMQVAELAFDDVIKDVAVVIRPPMRMAA